MELRENKLRIESLSKSYHGKKKTDFHVLDKISFEIQEGEFLVLLGPGLCGKSVLLNIVAGLEAATSGRVLLDGRDIKEGQGKLSMVFQKTGLFPWKTVVENVEIGPKYAGIDKSKRRKTAQKYIDLVGLSKFEKAYPKQLSGGMKQRVGIARAYATDPEILILDEPFGALDAQTRYSMEDEILKLWSREKKTILFVTNNIEEALYLGDRIVLLSERPAKVKQIYEIGLPRQRDMLDGEFLKLREEISENMALAL